MSGNAITNPLIFTYKTRQTCFMCENPLPTKRIKKQNVRFWHTKPCSLCRQGGIPMRFLPCEGCVIA